MLLLALGIAVLLFTAFDALWTTLWVNGGSGPLSSRLAAGLWWALRAVTLQGRTWPLSLAGPVVVIAVMLSWVALLWGGWVLVFSSDPLALSYTSTGEHPGWIGRVYFAGYTLFTLGVGNVVPRRGVWEIVTVVASGSGMLFITLGISYVISVLGAVVSSRAFAASVGGLGDSAEEIVRRAWDGERYGGLTLPLNALSTQLSVLTQQHLAYPVLHYYHARDPRAAPAAAVAVLDEALSIIRFGVPPECRPPESILEGARASIHSYLDTLGSAYVDPADRSPRLPDLSAIRDAGLPTLTDHAFIQALTRIDERRRKLLGMVEADAWQWPPQQP